MQDEDTEWSALAPRYHKADSRVCKTFATAEYTRQGGPKEKAFTKLPSRYYSPDDECMQAEATGFAQAQNLVRSFKRTSTKASIRILLPDDLSPAASLPTASGNSWSGGRDQGPPEPAPGCAAIPQPDGDARTPAPGACLDSCQQANRRHIAAHPSFIIQRPRGLDKTAYMTFSVRDNRGDYYEDADEQQPSLQPSSSVPEVQRSSSSSSSSRRVVEPMEPTAALVRQLAAASKDEGGQMRSPRSQPLSPSSPRSVPRSPEPQPAQRLKKRLSGVSFSAVGEDGGDEDAAPLSPSRLLAPRALSFLGRVGLVDCSDGQAEQLENLPPGSYSSQERPEADSTQLLMAKAFGSLHKVKSAVTADIEAKKEKLGVYRQSAAVPFVAAWGVKSPLKAAEVEPPAPRFRGKQSSRSNLLLGGLAEQPVDRAAGKLAELSVELFCCEDALDELLSKASPRVVTPLVQPLDLSRLKFQDDALPLDSDRSGSPRVGSASVLAVDLLRPRAPGSGPADSEKAPASPRSNRVHVRRLLCTPPGGLSPSPPAEGMDSRGSSLSPRGAVLGSSSLTHTRLRHRGLDVGLDDPGWMTGGPVPGDPDKCSAGQIFLPPVLRADLEACRSRPGTGSSTAGRMMELVLQGGN